MNRKIGVALVLATLTAGCSAIYGDHPAATSNTRPANAEELTVSKDTVKQMQSTLQSKGFYNGPIDGIVGPEMKSAIANYQQSQGLAKSTTLDAATIQALTAGAPAASAGTMPAGTSGSSATGRLTSDQVRQSLTSQGYTNVTNVQRWGDDDYAAQATKDGRNVTVGVDAHTGGVILTQ